MCSNLNKAAQWIVLAACLEEQHFLLPTASHSEVCRRSCIYYSTRIVCTDCAAGTCSQAARRVSFHKYASVATHEDCSEGKNFPFIWTSAGVKAVKDAERSCLSLVKPLATCLGGTFGFSPTDISGTGMPILCSSEGSALPHSCMWPLAYLLLQNVI